MSKSKTVKKPSEARDLIPVQPVGDIVSKLALADRIKVTGVKAVTRPVLRQIDDTPFAVTILSPIRESNLPRVSDQKMRPADVCVVLDLQTGEEMVLIANAAMKSGLEREYPDQGYVGKSFAMMSRKRQHKEGRTIREYMIKELIIEE